MLVFIIPYLHRKVMKEEMQLVQDMENAEERDSEGYVDKLEQILAVKMQGITALKKVTYHLGHSL